MKKIVISLLFLLAVPILCGWSVSRNGAELPQVLLLHMDGSDGSQTFTDSSLNNYTATVQGNTNLTTSVSVFGTAGVYFDGVSDSFTYSNQDDFAFGTGDFTIDFMINLKQTTGTSQFIVDFRTSNGLYPTIFIPADRKVYFYTNSGNAIVSTATITYGVWSHIALVRYNGVTKLYVDGVQSGSDYTDANNYSVSTNRPAIGASGANLTQYEMIGWLDEIRIIKGYATWTSNFTPPTSAYNSYSPANVVSISNKGASIQTK